MKVKSYRDLEVWQKSIDLVVECYRTSERFPPREIYGLTSQLRRAAISVAANIAEGQGREHTREFLHHLSIAYGSLMEAETHLLIAARLSLLPETSLQALLHRSGEVGRLLNGLIRALKHILS